MIIQSWYRVSAITCMSIFLVACSVFETSANAIDLGAETGEGVLRIGGKTIDTQNISDPVVGFIFNSSGLMANLTLEGTRFTRISR